jgi:hypothetical protein
MLHDELIGAAAAGGRLRGTEATQHVERELRSRRVLGHEREQLP